MNKEYADSINILVMTYWISMKVLIMPRRRHKVHTKLAAALALPCSLFLNNQLPVDPPLEVLAGAVINLSWPNPAFTNALTKVAVGFCLAESRLELALARPSIKCT